MKLTEEKLENILKRLDIQVHEILEILRLKEKLKNNDDIIFDNQQFIKVMNISKRTAQQWRDSKYIGFSQLGSKIYYKLSDIKTLLEDNYNPKINN